MSTTTLKVRTDIRLILLLGALAACGPIATDMYLPSLPSIAADFGVSAAAVQHTMTAYSVGFACGMLFYGPLSDTYGRRPILLFGITLFALAGMLCFLARSIDVLISMRMLQAFGAGAASVLARAIARDAHEPSEAARVLSMVALVTAIGPLLAPLLGGQILRFVGWRGIFVVLTSFGALCAFAAWRSIPETWPAEKRKNAAIIQSLNAYLHLLADPISWAYILTGGMAFASMFVYLTTTPFVYINYFHVSAQHYGWLFALNICGFMLGNFLNTRFIRRLGTERMISITSLISGVASLGVAFFATSGVGGLWSLVFCLFFVVGVIGPLGANCSTDLMHRYPRHAGTAAALYGAMQFGLGALATLMVGWLSNGTPRAMGVTMFCTGTLCLLGRMMVLRWHNRAVTGDTF